MFARPTSEMQCSQLIGDAYNEGVWVNLDQTKVKQTVDVGSQK